MEQKPAFGYLRVSTSMQVTDGVSLDVQRAKIEAYCTLHDHNLIEIFSDEGLSGKSTRKRPGLDAAIKASCEQKGVLVVYSLSRLARNTRDAIEISDQLEKRGADLASVTEKIDTSSAHGAFFFTLMAALATLERGQISERTQAALHHKKMRGERISRFARYGFDHVDDMVVMNEQEHQNIARMVELRATRLSYAKIGEQLATEGQLSRNGKIISAKVVRDVCKRETA